MQIIEQGIQPSAVGNCTNESAKSPFGDCLPWRARPGKTACEGRLRAFVAAILIAGEHYRPQI